MKREVDCRVFQESLDALSRGVLTSEESEDLRRHASACPDCGMALRVAEHLASATGNDLEAAVPEKWVGSMWPRVVAEIERRGAQRSRERRVRSVPRWFVPAAAAAALVLFTATGLLFAEVKRLRDREGALVERVAEGERRLEALRDATASDPIARTADLAGTSRLERLLARRRSVEVTELADLIAGLPPGTTLLEAAETEALVSDLPVWVRSVGTEAAREMELADGLQAGELQRLLDTLGADIEWRVPTGRIIAAYRRALRSQQS